MFEKESNFFIANQEQLVHDHAGKVLVLRGEEVVGVYDDALQAYLDAVKKYKPGTFMIQPCIAGSDAYTVTITSHELFDRVCLKILLFNGSASAFPIPSVHTKTQRPRKQNHH